MSTLKKSKMTIAPKKLADLPEYVAALAMLESLKVKRTEIGEAIESLEALMGADEIVAGGSDVKSRARELIAGNEPQFGQLQQRLDVIETRQRELVRLDEKRAIIDEAIVQQTEKLASEKRIAHAQIRTSHLGAYREIVRGFSTALIAMRDAFEAERKFRERYSAETGVAYPFPTNVVPQRDGAGLADMGRNGKYHLLHNFAYEQLRAGWIEEGEAARLRAN